MTDKNLSDRICSEQEQKAVAVYILTQEKIRLGKDYLPRNGLHISFTESGKFNILHGKNLERGLDYHVIIPKIMESELEPLESLEEAI